MKSDFLLEIVDLGVLVQVPAVHALEFPAFGLAFQKTQLYNPLRSE
jgi:hypothetical protein